MVSFGFTQHGLRLRTRCSRYNIPTVSSGIRRASRNYIGAVSAKVEISCDISECEVKVIQQSRVQIDRGMYIICTTQATMNHRSSFSESSLAFPLPLPPPSARFLLGSEGSIWKPAGPNMDLDVFVVVERCGSRGGVDIRGMARGRGGPSGSSETLRALDEVAKVEGPAIAFSSRSNAGFALSSP